MRKTAAAWGSALAALTVLAACAGSTPKSTTPTGQPEAFTIGLQAAWRVFDIQNISDQVTNNVSEVGYDRLVGIGSKNEPVPYLAKSWQAQGTSLLFHLRADATCSDGTPVTPTVVANSLKRMIKFSSQVPRAWGPGPFTVTPDDSAGTVNFSTGTPWGDLLPGFALPNAAIICPAGQADPSRLQADFVGSGPYTLTSISGADQMVLKLRPEWKWGPNGSTASTLPKTMTLKVIANNTTAANLLLTQGVDLAQVGGADVPRLKASADLKNIEQVGNAVFPLYFNHMSGHITADPMMRKAITTAVSAKDFLLAAYGAGLSVSSSSFMTPEVACYDANTQKLIPQTSIAAAKAVLESGGYTMSNGKYVKNGQPLSISVLVYPSMGTAASDYLVAQLNQLGAQTTLSQGADFTDRLRAGNFDISATPVSSLAPPSLAYDALIFSGPPPPAGANYSRIQNSEFDNAVRTAVSATSQGATCAAWATAQESLLKNFDYLPLGVSKTQWFVGKKYRVSVPQYIEIPSIGLA